MFAQLLEERQFDFFLKEPKTKRVEYLRPVAEETDET